MNILVLVRFSKDERNEEYVPLMWAKILKKYYGANIYCLTMDAKEKCSRYEKCYDYNVTQLFMLSDAQFVASDTYTTSKIISYGIKRTGIKFDIILTSYLSNFGETSHVPVSLAAEMDLPFAINVTDIICNEQTLTCVEDLNEYIQQINIPFPALIAVSNAQTQKFLNVNKPTLFDICNLERNDTKIYSLDDIHIKPEACGKKGSLTEVVASEKLTAKKEHEIIDDSIVHIKEVLSMEIKKARGMCMK